MNNSLHAIVAQLRQSGFRRLLVLSGEEQWVTLQLSYIKETLGGDWLTVSPNWLDSVPPEKAHLLLGREFTHGIFDAINGLHSEALAILAGALKAGSLLVLCTVPQAVWAQTPDADSLRWNEQHGLIPTPNFVRHLQHVIRCSAEVLMVEQGHEVHWSLLEQAKMWQPPMGQPTKQQQQVLEQLLSTQHSAISFSSITPKVYGLIAARGRGKSTVAGMLVQQWPGECWCCAPAKVATEVLEQYAGKSLTFWSPDSLLQYCQTNHKVTADWLIIDEASAIPSYILRQIISYFPRVLMTTTVDGYEGTGRGFMLKFCHSLENFTELNLDEPIRFARYDPLEEWMNQALLLQEPVFRSITSTSITNSEVEFHSISQAELAQQTQKLSAFYGLLTSAHYRTSPLDLRRLLDAQDQHFSVASAIGSSNTDYPAERYLGALWMVNEGGLSETLSWQIWAGLRRPRGNLVVQSLAAHSYFPLAAQLKSRRVMRIAVESAHRRQQIGWQLVERQKQQAKQQGLDFLSVSFGLTPELLSFWQSCGFHLMRIGSHKEASSGCFTAMAIMPISPLAYELCERGNYLLQRDLFWRSDLHQFDLKTAQEQHLNEEDWLELVGFSQYKRPISASSSAISRLLKQSELLLPKKHSGSALALYFQQGWSIEQICTQLGLTGQKQWLTTARTEVGEIIHQHQSELALTIQQKINACCL